MKILRGVKSQLVKIFVIALAVKINDKLHFAVVECDIVFTPSAVEHTPIAPAVGAFKKLRFALRKINIHIVFVFRVIR